MSIDAPQSLSRNPLSGAVAGNGAVTIVIAGPPTAKGRPRMTRKGFAYTPAATRKYEAHGRLAAQLAMDGRPPIAVPVRAEIVIDLRCRRLGLASGVTVRCVARSGAASKMRPKMVDTK